MSSRVCVDASLAVQWLIPTQQESSAESLLEAWDRAGTELVGPPLFDAEVTSAIRKQVYFRKLLPRQGEEAFRYYCELGVRLIGPPGLSELAWVLARKYNQVRTYDMQYLAVAELVDCELWTADKRLVDSLRGKVDRIRWVGEVGENA